MYQNFKIIIEYDGTNYHGWQKQKNDRTVQGEIERVLTKMTVEKVTLTGSGRTDAGVHALCQVANFKCSAKIKPEAFLKGINSLVDKDIVINECTRVDEHFHARYDAKSKIYCYRILNRSSRSALFRKYCWHIPKRLDMKAMNSAINHIIGSHNFKAFEGAGSPRYNSVRSVINASLLRRDDDFIIFKIEANGFLRFMVRNITGTLVDVGLGKITVDDFIRILISKNRNLAGLTAPPQGLFLKEVKY